MKFYLFDKKEKRILEYNRISSKETGYDFLYAVCEEFGFPYNDCTKEYTVSSEMYDYLQRVLERKKEHDSLIEVLMERYGTNAVLETLMDCSYTSSSYDPMKDIEEEENCLREKFSEFFP